MRKVKSINDVNMGDVLMYKNILGKVTYFDEDNVVILETIVDVEIMTNTGAATLVSGSDFAVDALDCHLIITQNALEQPHTTM
jgi:hypothetical protein